MSSQHNNIYHLMRQKISPSIFVENRDQIIEPSVSFRIQASSKQHTIMKDIFDLVQQADAIKTEGINYAGKEDRQYEQKLYVKVKKDLCNGLDAKRQIADKLCLIQDKQLARVISSYQTCQQIICSTFESILSTSENYPTNKAAMPYSVQSNQSQYKYLVQQSQVVNHWFFTKDQKHLDNPPPSSSQKLLIPKKSTQSKTLSKEPSDEQLYPFNNNIHYYKLVRKDKSLQKRFKWTQHEDEILLCFKYLIQDGQRKSDKCLQQLKQIIKDKTLQYVIERYVCMGQKWNETLIYSLLQIGQM